MDEDGTESIHDQVSATRLTVAPVGEIHRLVIVMPQDANVERSTGAASGVKVDLTEHPALDPGIKAYRISVDLISAL